jgi:DNA invertase Pin-like site-specific DNA recombinase
MTGPVVAAYLRVSTPSQGMGMQKAAVDRSAAAHGETIER